MAEELDDGEFWLPPKFLSDQDDDLVMDLTRPNESSDEDDDYLLLGLTQSLPHSSLSHKNNKWSSSNSPQSTLCNQGSSPDCTSPLLLGHSQMPPRGLLYVAAGEVAKIRQFPQPNTNTFLNTPPPPSKPPPLFVPANNPNRANQLQVMKQQQGNIRRGQQQMSPRNRGGNASNGRPLGLSPYAWPTLQQSRHPQQHYGSGMRAVFLQYPSTKGKCSGTGVFLPRPVGTPNQTLNKPACSTVLLPDRVVHALNLNLKDMDAFPQLQNKSKTSNAAIPSSDHGMQLASTKTFF